MATVRLTAMHHSARQAVKDIQPSLTILGSGEGCDLILASGKVDPTHAAIIKLGGAAYITDLGGPGGTTLNGRRIRWARLCNADIPAIGPFKFNVEIKDVADGIGLRPPVFRVRNDKMIGTVTSVNPVLVIGSDAGCDVVIREEDIAPRHCLIAWTDEGPIIRDLQRRSLVRHNGRRVDYGRLLHGDSIGIGPYELIFDIVTLPTGIAPSIEPAFGEVATTEPRGEAKEHFSKSLETIPDLNASWPSSLIVPADPAFDGLDQQSETYDHESQYAAGAPTASDQVGDTATDSTRATEFQPTTSPTPIGPQTDQSNEAVIAAQSRLAAAQNALDERARKIWTGLDAERERLRAYHAELQQKAQTLLDMTRHKRDGAPEFGENRATTTTPTKPFIEEHPASPIEFIQIEQPTVTSAAEKKTLEEVDRLFAGELPNTAAVFNAEETCSAGLREDSRKAKAGAEETIQQQAAELVDLVRIERGERTSAESKLESIRFEIERLRSGIQKNGDKHDARKRELEEQEEELAARQEQLRKERDTLTARLQQIEIKQDKAASELEETGRVRQELDAESVQIAQMQADHDDKTRELRVHLETERHRLRMRQTELQRKAAEVTHMARKRRHVIESELSEKRAQLLAQEEQLRTQREKIEARGRAQMEKAATELEQVLKIRLTDLESEVQTRQNEMESWMKTLTECDQSISGKSASKGDRGNTQSETGDDTRLASLQLSLEDEVATLQKAMQKMDEDIAKAIAVGVTTDTDEPGQTSSSPESRINGPMKNARLTDRLATLRGFAPNATDADTAITSDGTIPLAGGSGQ
jgi:pSer/pThr/pTyr-binding forkhead associated (FHA) protein